MTKITLPILSSLSLSPQKNTEAFPIGPRPHRKHKFNNSANITVIMVMPIHKFDYYSMVLSKLGSTVWGLGRNVI